MQPYGFSHRWLRRVSAVVGALLLALLLGVTALAADILRVSTQSDPEPADAALVLGAAVYTDHPSPVFAERLRHAVELYQRGQVRSIVMTGGTAQGDKLSEAEAGREWALAHGVPANAIYLEDRSRTTAENFAFAAPVLKQEGLSRVLVVTDPLHMRRALAIAEGQALDAHPSPTPTSLYTSLGAQAEFLAREVFYLAGYMLLGR